MKNQHFNSRRGGCLFKLITLMLVALVSVGAVIYYSMGYIVDYALKTATSGTGIEIGIGSVDLGIKSQRLGVNNFYISNPKDYSQGVKAISFKKAVVDADIGLSDFLLEKVITVDELEVEGLELSMLVNGNIDVSTLVKLAEEGKIHSNLTDIVAAFKEKYGSNGAPKEVAKATPAKPADPNAKALRYIVKKLKFNGGNLVVGLSNKNYTVNLPTIEILNLGEKEGGLTVSELITESVVKLAAESSEEIVKKLKEDTIKALGEKGGNFLKEKLGEGDSEKVMNALKKIKF